MSALFSTGPMANPGNTAATRSFRAKHTTLYASERECERYDTELCCRQDHAGEILRQLQLLAPWMSPASTRVADVGAGTGKLTRLLAGHCQSIAAFDRSSEVLAVAEQRQPSPSSPPPPPQEQHNNCSAASSSSAAVHFAVADARRLPLAEGSVDLVIAGWALSYLKSEHEEWYADGSYGGAWREEVDAALAELDRVLCGGGVCVLLETQGTATTTPQRDGSHFYAHLRARGFVQSTIRTDYRFPSRAQALATLQFFFGRGVMRRAEALLIHCDDATPCIVPECTALFWRRKRRLPALSRPRQLAVVTAAAVVAAAGAAAAWMLVFYVGAGSRSGRRRAGWW